ncbi:hypothetical protein SeMB42_g07491 [Synchytrium endobioticum]|uniref:Endonuclease/exonuclease/phosphatase domain-containing protein n=1 Tax=Synchytrium endobioticum TaxID=286115 RepID=A0A507C2Y6_9FUNG|nr:hypothetical protein SeMB42_g07491 [Synchytrium endobioticum]TPX46553.1 hypothetical protein SeLEV6574_g03177 [Synchytrium endobioticum]
MCSCAPFAPRSSTEDSVGSPASMDNVQAILPFMRVPPPRDVHHRPFVYIHGHGIPGRALPFTLLTYNTLSPTHAANHPYLYASSVAQWDDKVLDVSFRHPKILQELEYYNADIVCLQEVDAQHWHSLFKPHMHSRGYNGIYKQRTNQKPDGLALFYKTNLFDLVASKSIEYINDSPSGIGRDNVGVLALLQARDEAKPCICIATTHLLFNPRRGLVKLTQIQRLAEEAAWLAAIGESSGMRVPIVICGDMNFTPDSLIYEYLMRGSACIPLSLDSILSGLKRNKTEGHYQGDHSSIFDVPYHQSYDHDSIFRKLPLRLVSALAPHTHVETNQPYVTTAHDMDAQMVDFIFYGERRSSSSSCRNASIDGAPDDAAKSQELLDVRIRCTGYLEPPTIDDQLKLPNPHLPSDHVLLLAGFTMEGLPYRSAPNAPNGS